MTISNTDLFCAYNQPPRGEISPLYFWSAIIVDVLALAVVGALAIRNYIIWG